jgi:hypothetical protein
MLVKLEKVKHQEDPEQDVQQGPARFCLPGAAVEKQHQQGTTA